MVIILGQPAVVKVVEIPGRSRDRKCFINDIPVKIFADEYGIDIATQTNVSDGSEKIAVSISEVIEEFRDAVLNCSVKIQSREFIFKVNFIITDEGEANLWDQ